MSARRIPHGELTLALHELAPHRDVPSGAPPLLLVHELEGSAAALATAPFWRPWPGRVLALDLAGHGASEWRHGGAYTPELFAADVDAVLADVGPCALAGAGIGAYAALLVAGARPDLAPAALLLAGRGLDGGGPEPEEARTPSFLESLDAIAALRATRPATDPLTRSCATDLRPPDYARAFAAAAACVLLAEDGSERPPWWTSIRDLEAVAPAPGEPEAALRALARACSAPSAR